MALRFSNTAERPTLDIWWLARDTTLIDFSSGYTFSLKIGTIGSTAVLTKTTGITGATGSGVEPTGVPNIQIAWSAGELATLNPNNLLSVLYDFILTATISGLDRVLRDTIEIPGTIT
jgi:hypothetical protein